MRQISAEANPGRRADVLAVLRSADSPLGIAALAQRLAIHPNTVRFHLETLVKNGQVQRVEANHAKPGRPPQLFRATPGMDPAGPRRYRLLAEVLTLGMAHDSDPAGRAVAAGRLWGAQLGRPDGQPDRHDAIERLTGLLDDLGFAPERSEDAEKIRLRSCPFLELASSHRDVICPVHLGLMQGALAAWNAPITVDALTPFAQPDLCLAHLKPAGHPA